MGLGDFLFGTSGGVKKIDRLTKEQKDALRGLLQGPGIREEQPYQMAVSRLTDFLGPQGAEAFAGPIMQQFEEEVIPGIAERFGGIGAGSSSALNQALAQASVGLGTNLGQLRAQLQQSLMPQALSFAQAPFSNLLQALQVEPYEFVQQQGGGGIAGPLLSAAGMALGGPIGGAIGGGLASMFSGTGSTHKSAVGGLQKQAKSFTPTPMETLRNFRPTLSGGGF